MDFAFSETQKEVSGLAKQIFAGEITAKDLKTVEASDTRIHHKLWKDLAAAGLLGLSIPEEFGGGGQGFLELCALLEQAGAAVAPVPLWPTLVLGALPIAEFGSPEQKRRYLPRVAAGEIFLTAALEEQSNFDARKPQTAAKAAGTDFLLSGTKICVPTAELAERVIVPAHSADGVGLFLVDPRAHGVKLERQIATTGEHQARMTLDGVRVAADDVLVKPAGAAAITWLVEHAQVALCALELGVAGRALRMTAEYTTTRQQFDRPIATFQAVAQRAADAYIDVESIRVTTWQAAWLLSERRDAAGAVALAKFTAADAGHRVVYAAQHLHAGIGFDKDYPLHRYYMWSKQLELTLGSASQALARLGDALAQPLPAAQSSLTLAKEL